MPPHPAVTIRRTRRGWRLSQQGVVLSEVLEHPGPTDSVFDVLAALCLVEPVPRNIALLGLGGGGTVAALRALHSSAHVHGVDLDPRGFDLLAEAGSAWTEPLSRHHEDAVAWLTRCRRRFDVLVEDLSVCERGEVVKPAATWEQLPSLIAARLAPRGRAIFNLLRPSNLDWSDALRRVREPFRHVLAVRLLDFENHLLLASQAPLDARRIGCEARRHLRRLGSKQAARFAMTSRLPRP